MLRLLTQRFSNDLEGRVKYSTWWPSRSDSPSAARRAMPMRRGLTGSGSKGRESIGCSPFVRYSILSSAAGIQLPHSPARKVCEGCCFLPRKAGSRTICRFRQLRAQSSVAQNSHLARVEPLATRRRSNEKTTIRSAALIRRRGHSRVRAANQFQRAAVGAGSARFANREQRSAAAAQQQRLLGRRRTELRESGDASVCQQ